MSKTIVDFPKVTQMLDAGWQVLIYKNPMGSYEVEATHRKTDMVRAVQEKIIAGTPAETREIVRETMDGDNTLSTDDFTPEQALTRMAYKCHGEIL